MFAPSTLDQQFAATWNAARIDVAGGGRRSRPAARRGRLRRLIRGRR